MLDITMTEKIHYLVQHNHLSQAIEVIDKLLRSYDPDHRTYTYLRDLLVYN